MCRARRKGELTRAAPCSHKARQGYMASLLFCHSERLPNPPLTADSIRPRSLSKIVAYIHCNPSMSSMVVIERGRATNSVLSIPPGETRLRYSPRSRRARVHAPGRGGQGRPEAARVSGSP